MEVTKQYLDQQFNKFGEKFSQIDKRLDLLTTITLVTQEDLAVVKADVKDIKDTVRRVDKRDMEDSNLFAKIHNDHEKRLKKLEKAMKIR